MKAKPTVFDITSGQAFTGDLIREYPPRVHKMLQELPEARMAKVREFIRELELTDDSPQSIVLYLHAIRTLGHDGKPYEELSREELIGWQYGLQRGDGKRFSKTSIDMVKRFVKRFLRFCHNGTLSDRSVPHAIDCIRYSKSNPDFQREILTAEEIRAIIEACHDQRDRALLAVLYESGARAGEMCSLRIRDVKFDQYGAVIVVKGKTGPRRIRLIESVPDLQLWVNMHRYRDDPEAPLWLSSKGEKQGIRRHHLHGMVKKRARQAGIKKRVHPHLFRHTRATHLANSLTEAQMREFFGWTKRSEIPAVYVHLSGRDIDQALLKHYGVKAVEEKQGEEVLKPAECPRCKSVNPAGAKFCMHCSMVLDSREARILDDRLKHADNAQVLLVRYLVEHAPEMLEKILKQPEIKQELEKALSDGGGN